MWGKINCNQVQVHRKSRLRHHAAEEWKSCLSKMSSFQELRKIALFFGQTTAHFFAPPEGFWKVLVSPRLIDLSQARGQCNPSFWIKTCEHHQDSSYSVRFCAKSSISMHMGPGLFLHLSGCICPFTSLFLPFAEKKKTGWFSVFFWRRSRSSNYKHSGPQNWCDDPSVWYTMCGSLC